MRSVAERVLTLPAYAKINLFLDIVGTRADGYHLLSTVMQQISLFDEVRLRRLSRVEGRPAVSTGNWFFSYPEAVQPLFERLGVEPPASLLFRAAVAFAQTAAVQPAHPIRVEIGWESRLPSLAGIGAGSADAAAVLRGMDRLFPDLVSRASLFEIAADLGADVPFCLHGGIAHCTGIGEVIRPLKPLEPLPLLLIKPDVAVSTVRAFHRWDHLTVAERRAVERPDTAACLAALERADWATLRRAGGNVFEAVVAPDYPALPNLLQAGYESGALFCRMSGSGSAVFALYADAAARDAAADQERWKQAAGGVPCRLYCGHLL
jgi:4-diphosphocytidyl-2-C-methyl-D-erythritol kinase